MDFEKKIVSARAGMVMQAPHFAPLVFGLKVLKADVKKPQVDGSSLSFGEEYIEALPKDELKGVLAGCSLICGNGHPWRMAGKDPELWSTAAAMVVKPAVEESGFNLPDDWPGDSRFGPHTAIEEVYRILKEEQQEGPGDGGNDNGPSGSDGDGGGSSPGSGGDSPDDSGADDGDSPGGMEIVSPKTSAGSDASLTPSEAKQQEQDWKIKLIQMAQEAEKSSGDLPGWIKGLIKEVARPKVDWRAVLRRFLEEFNKDDYCLAKRNRRFSTEDVVFPGLYSEGSPRLIVGMDYSGSVTKPERTQFLGELNSILEEYNIAITVVFFDSAVQDVKEYTREDLPIQDDSGYGGTRLNVPFDWIDEHAEQLPTACIVCSDMEDGSFPAPPPYPTLWVSTQPVAKVKRWWPGDELPFGEIIEIDVAHGSYY